MSKTTVSKVTPLYAETRILLSIKGKEEEQVSPSNFVPKGEKYQQALVRLVEQGYLTKILIGKRYKKYTLTDEGDSQLTKNLLNEEFSFFANMGAKTANSLLTFIRQQNSISTDGSIKDTPANSNSHSITSYEDFSQATLQTYDELNSSYQFENLVPIYHIRRTLGDQVSRNRFNEWLLDMQANDQLQLIGGEMPELTPDKAEDSIKTSLGGIRYYAKRL